MQTPQRVHFSISMTGRLLIISIAFSGHFFSHKPQEIQPTLQACRTFEPLSALLQKQRTRDLFGKSSSIFWGQRSTQIPHPLHRIGSITGKLSSLITIAPKGQARTQSPYPRQVYSHTQGLNFKFLAIWQLLTPWVIAEVLASFRPPWHKATAMYFS